MRHAIAGEAGRAHGGDQRLKRLVDDRPLDLLIEQKLDGGERLVVPHAAREHEGCHVERVARAFAKDESDLAGVDVALSSARERLRGWALVGTGLTQHNLPADCSNDRADECFKGRHFDWGL